MPCYAEDASLPSCARPSADASRLGQGAMRTGMLLCKLLQLSRQHGLNGLPCGLGATAEVNIDPGLVKSHFQKSSCKLSN